MILLPSRGRPEKLARFLKAYRDTGGTEPGLLMIEARDEAAYAGIELPANWRLQIVPESLISKKFNDGALVYAPGEPCYMICADDMVPETHGWDVALKDACLPGFISHGDDKLTGSEMSTHFCVSGEVVRRLGYLANPKFGHFYWDNVLRDVGMAAGIFRAVPGVVTRHLHWSITGEFDQTSKERGSSDADAEIYALWQQTERAADVARVIGTKAPSSVAVVCVEMGDYCGRGERYVRTLKAMVARHLNVPHTFYCITDTPKSGINCIEADPRAPGWWQKLHQFKHGLFTEDKILSFDLDTFVIGNIDKIVELDTDLALIRDFWRPQVAMNAVMLWRNGGLAHLFWDFYEEQGFPQEYAFGDGGWMGDQAMPKMNFHMLQDQFPGQLVSYKTECMKIGLENLKAAPVGARIVCFHGHPRPHEADGWARGVWNQYKPVQSDEASRIIRLSEFQQTVAPH